MWVCRDLWVLRGLWRCRCEVLLLVGGFLDARRRKEEEEKGSKRWKNEKVASLPLLSIMF